MPLKIGILYDPNHPHVINWANALKKQNAEVLIFSLQKNKKNNLPVIYIPPALKTLQGFLYPSYFLAKNKLKEELRKHKIDVLHPIHLTPYGTWARLTGFRPVIPMAIGLDVLNYLTPNTRENAFWNKQQTKHAPLKLLKNKILFPYYKKQILKNIQNADYVVADGKFLIDIMKKHVPNQKYQTIHWGVRPELYQKNEELRSKMQQHYKIDFSKKFILAPRGLAPVYNPETVLKTAEKLLPKLPKQYLFIVLSNGYTISKDALPLLEKLQELHKNFLFFPQRISPNEIAQIWLNTEVFLSIPLEDGLPVSLHEAMFTGALPVLAKLPSYEEILLPEHRKFQVHNKYSPEEVARKILEALQFPNKDKLRRRQKKQAEKYGNIYNNARYFIELCKKIL